MVPMRKQMALRTGADESSLHSRRRARAHVASRGTAKMAGQRARKKPQRHSAMPRRPCRGRAVGSVGLRRQTALEPPGERRPSAQSAAG